MNASGEHAVGVSAIVRSLARPLPTTPQAAVVATTAEGRIFFWNEGAERLLGWSASDAIRRHISELGPRHVRERTTEFLALVQTGLADGGPGFLWRKTGIPVPCFMMMIVLGDVSRGCGAIVGVSVPASQRRRLERDGPRIRAELHRRLRLRLPERRDSLTPRTRPIVLDGSQDLGGRYAQFAQPTRLARTLARQGGIVDDWSAMQVIEACRYRAERTHAPGVVGRRARRAAAMWLRVAGMLGRRSDR